MQDDLPPSPTIYNYYDQRNKDGHWEHVSTQLAAKACKVEGLDHQPSLIILISRSLKTVEKENVFIDSVNSRGREGLAALAITILDKLPQMEKKMVNQSFTDKAAEAAASVCVWEVDVGDSEHRGFVSEFMRRAVEFMSGWPLYERHLNKDYEQLSESSESTIVSANIRLVLRRLTAPPHTYATA